MAILQKIILLLFLPIFFIVLAITSSTLHYILEYKPPFPHLSSISSLYFNHEIQSLKKPSESFLLKGEKIRGSFFSQENNLGSVYVYFNSHERFNSDIVIFKIKESAMNDWYYEEKYDTMYFTGLPLFPFGFPLILNSKNKTYDFEITSTQGTKKNSVSLDFNKPFYITAHQFSKNDMVNKKKNFIEFIFKKVVNLHVNTPFHTVSVIQTYILPFLLSLLTISRIDKQNLFSIRESSMLYPLHSVSGMILCASLILFLFFSQVYLSIALFYACILLWYVSKEKIPSKPLIFYFLACVIVSFFFSVVKKPSLSLNFLALGVIFLLVQTTHETIQFVKEKIL